MILALKFLKKFHPKPSSPYTFRSDVDNDIVSGASVENVGVDVLVKFGDYRLNGFLDIRGADFVSDERTNEHGDWRSLSQ